MCLQSADMKCSSHKKWLSSVSSTEGYNGGPVRIDTGPIVIQTHTHTKGRGVPKQYNRQRRRSARIPHLVIHDLKMQEV